jgi:negative regulator of sigma E activity
MLAAILAVFLQKAYEPLIIRIWMIRFATVRWEKQQAKKKCKLQELYGNPRECVDNENVVSNLSGAASRFRISW